LQVAFTTGGTASSGSDYTALGGSATIAAGQTWVDVTVTPIDDTLPEAAETVILTLSANPAYTLDPAAKTATVTIADNEPVVSVAAQDPNATEEGPDTGTFRITRSIVSANPLQVAFTTGGTASSGSDYIALGGSATIPGGQVSVDVTVTPVDDALAEPAETVILTLSAAATYTLDPAAKTATVTIADNEPVISIAATDPNASEQGPDTGTFRITRSLVSANPLQVGFATTGTASSGSDYTSLGWSATIPGGQASVDVTVTPIDDTLAEPAETVILTLSAAATYTVDPAARSATVTIADNEPVVSVVAQDPNASEQGPDTGTFRITRSLVSANPLQVAFTTTGTASSGSDYTSLGWSATIPGGQASADVAVTPIDDTLPEPAETVILTLSAGTAYTLDPAAKTATVTIADNEPVVSVAAPDPDASEVGPDTGTFRITRSTVSANPLQVGFTTGGTASSGSDYTALGWSATIPGGQASVDLNVVPFMDLLTEGAETVILTISAGTTYTLDPAAKTATVTILNGPPVTVAVTAPNAVASEAGPDDGTFRFARSVAGSGPLDVRYSVGGTAQNGTDYIRLTGTATIPAGQAFLDVAVQPIPDALLEQPETVIVTLLGSTTYLTPGGPATVTIADGPALIVCVTAPNPNASEEGPTNGTFRIMRNIVSANPLQVGFTTSGTASSGSDYTALGSSATIPAGQASVDVTVAPVDDTLAEPAETVILTLNTSSAYLLDPTRKTDTVTIADNEPVVQVTALYPDAAEEGPLPGTLRISRDVARPQALTVAFAITGTAINGTDYTRLGTTATIPANETFVDVVVTPIDDLLPELPETVILTLSANPTYTISPGFGSGTVTIADNEPVISVVATEPYASEDGKTGTFRVSRSGTATGPLTVTFQISGTATSGADYTPVASWVTLQAGQSVIDVVLTPIDDTAQEPDETFTVTLTPNGPYTVNPVQKTATLTIADNDIGPDTFEVDNAAAVSKTLVPGTAQRHNFHVASDNDWVKFIVPNDGTDVTLMVTTSPLSQIGRKIYGPNSSQALYSEDVSQGSFFDMMTLNRGTYYVQFYEAGQDHVVSWYDLLLTYA